MKWFFVVLVVVVVLGVLVEPAQASPVGCTWEGRYGLVCCHGGALWCR